MKWLFVISSIFYYLLYPVSTLFGWLLIVLSPVLHLGSYIFSGVLFPLRLVVRLETMYIYLGVAAVIGLVAGSILHLASSLLVSLFKLTPVPEEKGRSAASVRATREQKKLEEAWQSSPFKGEQIRLGGATSLEKDYTDWQDKDPGKRREDDLFKQTILEDDSEEEL